MRGAAATRRDGSFKGFVSTLPKEPSRHFLSQMGRDDEKQLRPANSDYGRADVVKNETCHGCNSALEPLAQIRTYHTQCDPRGKVDHLRRQIAVLVTALEDITDALGQMKPTATVIGLADEWNAARSVLAKLKQAGEGEHGS